jgi:hypothetical protein
MKKIILVTSILICTLTSLSYAVMPLSTSLVNEPKPKTEKQLLNDIKDKCDHIEKQEEKNTSYLQEIISELKGLKL